MSHDHILNGNTLVNWQLFSHSFRHSVYLYMSDCQVAVNTLLRQWVSQSVSQVAILSFEIPSLSFSMSLARYTIHAKCVTITITWNWRNEFTTDQTEKF